MQIFEMIVNSLMLISMIIGLIVFFIGKQTKNIIYIMHSLIGMTIVFLAFLLSVKAFIILLFIGINIGLVLFFVGIFNKNQLLKNAGFIGTVMLLIAFVLVVN